MSLLIPAGLLLSTLTLTVGLLFAVSSLNLSRTIRVSAKSERLKRLAAYLEMKIAQSGVQTVLPVYNLTFHTLVSLASSVIIYGMAVREFEKLTLLVGVAAIGFLLPTMVLQLASDYMSYVIRKGSVDMVVAVSSAYATEPDIFRAFESIADYAIPPLRSRIKIMVGEYNLKISPVKCLNRYKASINSPDLQSLIAQMTIKYVEGGSMTPLFSRYLEHVKKISENEENEKVEDFLTNIALYVGIFVDIVSLHVMLNSEFRGNLLNTLWGQSALILNLVMVAVIIVMSLKRH